MREGKPSQTAFMVAAYRAAHQLIDRPVIFEDPLAIRILGPEIEAALDKNPRHFEHEPHSAPFLRAILAVRSRIAEEALARAVKAGIRQYVLLGAGLDTFAYRNPYSDLRVFEVDYPATQEGKRGLLERAGIPEPANVTYVPVDFARDDLGEALRAAGIRAAQFTWLGVAVYVSKDIVRGTLQTAAGLAGQVGGVALDYMLPPETQPPWIRAALEERMARLKELGEPWTSFFLPEEMGALLRGAGFHEVEDLGMDALNATYFADRSDGLQVGSVGRVVAARK